MSEPINAGMLSDVTNFLKQLSDTLFKAIDKLCSIGLMSDVKKNEYGGVDAKLHINGEVAEITTKQNDKNPDAWDVTITAKGKKTISLKNIPKKNFQDELLKMLHQIYPDAEFKDVQSSKVLKVQLQKVTSSRSIDIQCTGIYANYSYVDALSDLDTVLNDDTFIDMISEDPAAFEISDAGDDYDVDNTESFDTSVNVLDIMNYAYIAMTSVCNAIWNLSNSDACSDLCLYRDRLISDLDELSAYADSVSINMPACSEDYSSKVIDYIACLSYNSNNITSELSEDLQSALSSIAAYWESTDFWKSTGLTSQ